MIPLSAIIILVLTFSQSRCIDVNHREWPFGDNKIVQELVNKFSSIDIYSHPNGLYYSIVIHVYRALQNGLLKSTGKYYKMPEGIELEEYIDAISGVAINLPSISALESAKLYLTNKRKRKETKKPTKSEVDAINDKYFNSLCYRYEGLLNNVFSVQYLSHPLKDLRQNYLAIGLNSYPDELYYTTVMKSADAVERGILIPMGQKADKGEHGVMTQIYQVPPDLTEYRLISHQALDKAEAYFSVKVHELCGRAPDNWSQ